MLNSLSEQLLKAGLITQEKIDQAAQERQQQKEKAKARQAQKSNGPKNAKAAPEQAHPTKPRHNKGQNQGPDQARAKGNKPDNKPAREASDLEKFYRERASLERQEKAEEERLRREAAERKKRTRQQVRELILAHQLNVEDASVRYNFVVGDTIKYLFVTEQQQQELAEGKLAITFLDGKRCLLPVTAGKQLLELDPGKLVVFNQDQQDQGDAGQSPADTLPAAPITPSEAE